MQATTLTLPALLKVLCDPTRLRILGLLELAEVSVGELSRALGMTQSRVSNHLRVLRDSAFLSERHVGVSTFLRPALDTRNHGGNGQAKGDLATELWTTLRRGLDDLPEHSADRMRLQELLAAREAGSADFFESVAGEWDKIGAQFKTGQSRQRAVANLIPSDRVFADLGCGTGYMARALVGIASRIICVDRSQAMLAEARKRLEPAERGLALDFRCGALDALPMADDEVDGALAGMVLHHLAEPGLALSEMHRVIRPGGQAVVLELAPHKETWMHEAQGDRHLGLQSGDVAAAFRRAGFDDVRIESVADRYSPARPDGEPAPELSLYIVRGRVPRATTDR